MLPTHQDGQLVWQQLLTIAGGPPRLLVSDKEVARNCPVWPLHTWARFKACQTVMPGCQLAFYQERPGVLVQTDHDLWFVFFSFRNEGDHEEGSDYV